MSWLWIGIAAVVLLAAISQGGNPKKSDTKQVNSHWIYHPHVIKSDSYECSHCHSRFRKESVNCPKCGTRKFGKTVTDETEWMDEEEELDIIFDDD